MFLSDKFCTDLISLKHLTFLCYSYPSCSGAKAPGLAADMHFKDDVIAFIGPACAFALEPVARLAAYWNSPIITGMGDQVWWVFKNVNYLSQFELEINCLCGLVIMFQLLARFN